MSWTSSSEKVAKYIARGIIVDSGDNRSDVKRPRRRESIALLASANDVAIFFECPGRNFTYPKTKR